MQQQSSAGALRSRPHRVDLTLKREWCTVHKDVVVKKTKLRKSKQVACWKCLQGSIDGLRAAEQAALNRARAMETALEAERGTREFLQKRCEDMEKERGVMNSQMANLMEQVTTLSTELSSSLKLNAVYEQRLRELTANPRSVSPNESGRRSPTASIVLHAAGGPAGSPTKGGSDSPVSSSRPSSMGSSDTVVLMPTSDPSPSTGKATAVGGRKGQESGSRESASAAKASSSSSSSSSGSRETAAVKPDTKELVAIASPMKPMKPAELARKKQEEAAVPKASADGASKNGKKKSKWVFHLGKHKRATGKAEEEVKEETPAGPVDELDEPMSVAELTEKLRLLLDTSPHDLKRVYVKSEPLAQWRLEVLCDMQLQGPADEPAKHQRQSSEGRLFVSDELEGVKQLLDRIRRVTFAHVQDAFDLARTDPELLRQALAVIQLHQAFEARKVELARAKVDVSSGASLKDMLRLCAMEDWDADVVSTLKTASAERAVELFTKEHVAAATQGGTDGQGLSRIQSMLAASRQLLKDVDDVVVGVEPIFPPRYRVKEIIRRAYDDHLGRQILTVCQGDISDFEVGDVLELRRYLDEHIKQMAKLGEEHPRDDLEEVKQKCFQEYLVKTRVQMTEWFTNILTRESPVMFEGEEGRPVTSTPEDLFQLILCHLDIASAGVGLEGNDLASFILVVLNSLKAFVAEHTNAIRTVKLRRRLPEHVEASTVAAYINDYDRLQDKVSELRDQLLDSGKIEEHHLGMIDPVLDQLKEEVAVICLESNSLLSYLVLRDATSTLLKSSPFDPHSTRVVDEALLTFQDYFGDLRVWLPQFFFAHVVRTCFESLVALYVVSVLRGTTTLADPLQTAQDMRNHKEAIKTVMNEYTQELTQAGLADVTRLFVVVDDLAEVMAKGTKLWSAWTGYLLRDLPPAWNVDAVQVLADLRGDVADKKERGQIKTKMADWFNRELKDWRPGGVRVATQKSPLWKLRASPLPAAQDVDTFLWDLATSKDS